MKKVKYEIIKMMYFQILLLIIAGVSAQIIYRDLDIPSGLGIDNKNYIYIANTQGKSIVKIDIDGNLINTFPSTSQWLNPNSVAIDNNGDMYIVCTGTGQVVQTDSLGNMLSSFSMSNPRDVAVDASGIYVAGGTNQTIFKMAKNQNFFASLVHPQGMKIDIEGNIYVADTGNNRVIQFNYLGQVTNTYTTSNPTLNTPSDVFIDEWNNLYITDTGNARIVKLSQSGQQLASYTTDLTYPVSLAVDDSGIYVTNIDQVSTAIKISFGQNFTVASSLNQPNGITVDSSGQMYILDYGNNRVVKLDLDGNELLNFDLGQATRGGGITIDSSNNLYITDTPNKLVLIYDSNGNFIQKLSTSILLASPRQIAADASGIYIADGNTQIIKFGKSQTFVQGKVISYYLSTDGLGNFFTFVSDYMGNDVIIKSDYLGNQISAFNPTYIGTAAIASDSLGNVYASSFNFIVKYTSNGGFIGIYSSRYMQHGTGIGVATSGNIYVIDQIQSWVVKFDPSGTQSTYFTIGGNYYSCYNLAIDGFENIYVACSSYNVVVKLNSAGNVVGTFNIAYPYIIAADAFGNFYVNNNNGNSILKYDTNGNYKTSYPYNNPDQSLSSLAVDSSGLYVTSNYNAITKINFDQTLITNLDIISMGIDSVQYVYVLSSNSTVYKVDTMGNIVKIFSDSLITNASGIGLDKQGNIYIMDMYSGMVVELNSVGTQIAMWHEPILSNPNDIVVNPSGIYIVSNGNNMVLKIPLNEIFTPDDILIKPWGITVDSNGSIYIADSATSQIVKLDYNGNQIGLFASLNSPTNILVKDGVLYIANTGNSQIVVLNATTGNILSTANNVGQPQSVAIDSTGMYIVDEVTQSVLKFGFNKTFSVKGSLVLPLGIAVDSNQFMYIADTGLKAVIKLDRFGNMVQFFNISTSNALSAVTVDNNYNVYVTILRGNQLIGFDPEGNVILNTNSNMSSPVGLTTDSNRNIYVANSGSSTVLKVPHVNRT